MPCPFTGRKIFRASPNFLSQPKNLTAFSASTNTFVTAQKNNFINANHRIDWHKMFVTAAICKYFFWSSTKNLDQPKTSWVPLKDEAIILLDSFSN